MEGVGPGTTLDGRYTTGRRIEQRRGYERWLAEDSSLGRTVVVLCLPERDPRASAVLDAARRAASLEAPTLVRVLDVGSEAGVAYVIESDTSSATTLAGLVTDGGLPADEVRRIVGETATALESGRNRGLHHLDLRPEDVSRDADGEVRVRGLATAAALAGHDDLESEEASRRDAVGVVSLAYAGLTGLWPLASDTALATAPRVVDAVAAPSEIAAGVPRDLDALCRLTLVDDQGPTTPGDFARQIAPWPSRHVVTPTRPSAAAAPASTTSAASSTPGPAAPAPGTTASDDPPTVRLPAALKAQPGAASAPGTTDADTATDQPGGAKTAPAAAAASAAASATGAALATAGSSVAGAVGKVGSRARTLSRQVGERASEKAAERRGFHDRITAPNSPGLTAEGDRLRPGTGHSTALEAPAPLVPARQLTKEQSRLALSIVAGCLVIAMILGVWGVSRIGSQTDLNLGGMPESSPTATSPSANRASPSTSPTAGPAGGQPLQILGADGFDPEGDGRENGTRAPRVFDGDPSTVWQSEGYSTAALGALKSGVGVTVDLGPNVTAREVKLTLGNEADVSVYIGAERSLNGATKIGERKGADGTVSFPVGSDVRGQYVIVWFTSLTRDDGGRFRAILGEVEVLN